MNPYPKSEKSQEKYFEADTVKNLPVKYGLPEEVKFCKKCVISNQRPNSAVETKHTKDSLKETIGFNHEGICEPCVLAENKKGVIDWDDKDQELRDLCDRFRKNDGSYDCLVPGSGGKDSFYAAHILKYKYNMNPLTVTWAPHLYTDWGWKNFQSWIGAGFDNYLMTPNARVHRLVTRLAVEKLLHPFQPFIIGQKNFAPKMADLFDIPLVFYGENESEYGNPIANSDSALRDTQIFASKDRKDLYIGGVSTSDLKENYGLKEVDIEPYLPIEQDTLSNKNIEVHYLGYYIPWHPQGAYYYAVENGGFIPSPERTPGTYSKYNSIDDKIDDYHYYTTYIKFGIGRATYDAAQEVRNDEITREEGIALVKKYDGEYPDRFEKEIFEYLSINEKEFPIASKMFEQPIMDRAYFDDLCDTFRSPHLWKKESNGWVLRSKVF
tara:strand:- start:342 stop:1655 length:1314 start_codon:yes stop_codon:yes gene_type:complete